MSDEQFEIRNPKFEFALSVIVVNWNADAYLPAALDSLLAACKDIDTEVWFVDNASSDASLQIVSEGYPQLHVIANAENLGFAAANNQGIKRARGRYLLLLNPDTELPPTALTTLIAFMDDHADVGVVGPRLQGKGGKVQGGAAGYDPSPATIFNFASFLYRIWPRRLRGLWLPRSLYAQTTPIAVDWISGACMLVRQEAVAQAGPLDERYFMYSEDVEWCRRMRTAGFQVVCYPAVSVTHHIGGSSRQHGADFYAHNVDSLDMDLRSRYGSVQVAVMHFFSAFGFLLRYLLYEFYFLRWCNPVHAELRDLWVACLKTSLRRMVRPAEKLEGKTQKAKGKSVVV